MKSLSAIEFRIEQAWLDIAELRATIDEKTKRIDNLTKQGLRPYFTSDLPTIEWQAIAMRYAAIGALEELRHLIKRKTNKRTK